MIKLKHIHVFYFIVIGYILINAYVLLFSRGNFYSFNLLPAIILVFLLAFFDIEKIMYLMVFTTPLAISLKEMGYAEGANLSLPSEPLMAGVTIIYLLNQFHHGVTDKRILRHPVTKLIFIQLTWMIITMCSSELPYVSIKYVLSRIWFLTSCYFLCSQFFTNRNSMVRHILFYSVALAIVAIITTVKHARFGFDEKTADWIVSPFYNDHTAYGAALAMYIPVLVGLLFTDFISNKLKIICLGLVSVFLVSIVISYARAGWLSLFVAVGVLVTILLGIKFRTILVTLAIGLALFLFFQSEVLMLLGRNNTDSDGDFAANLESMTNISTDVSNMERLNRWSCAISMFEDKPYLGSGPGTYQFLYAPFQKSGLKTYISTNFGNKGNAHSEYLGPLSEQGLLGGVIVLVLVMYVVSLGYKLAYAIKEKSLKIFTISVLMAMCTYFVHGLLNNFLDTDKASVPFWGFLAMLVCIDVFHQKHESSKDATLY